MCYRTPPLTVLLHTSSASPAVVRDAQLPANLLQLQTVADLTPRVLSVKHEQQKKRPKHQNQNS